MPALDFAAQPAGQKSRFFEGLSARDLNAIRAAARERRYLASSVITNQGNPADHLFLLVSGRARHFYLTQNGQKTLLFWLTAGDVFGGIAFLCKPAEYLLSTEAVHDSSVLVWDRASMRSLAGQYPRLAENALLIASEYLAWYLADHVALICDSARERLAQVLICLSGIIGKQVPDGVEFDATNEELASAANVSPFTASRLMSEWQTSRVIVKRRGKILLRSPERLFLRVV
ncbi:MAG: Crp/Fnr family transcriptional regulator [Candidatus Acidiferrum sp.]